VSRAGASLVVGVDVTDAVDAAFDNLGSRDNVSFIQADIFHLPLKKQTFDYAYSIGVLHHTPDPRQAFSRMIDTTRAGGGVGLSVYEISLYHRPNRNSLKVVTMDLLWAFNLWRCELFRSVTTRVPQRLLLSYCKYVIPILHRINKIPVIRGIRYFLPSTCYRHLPVEWSMLDSFDTYATKIVHQYRHKDIFQWFVTEGLDQIIVHNGRAGWVSLTGVRPMGKEREQPRVAELQPMEPREKPRI